MSEDTRRRWRRALGGGAAVAVAVAAVVVPAAPASAADPAITAGEQPFYAYYSLGKIHSAGYTGRGGDDRPDRRTREYPHPGAY